MNSDRRRNEENYIHEHVAPYFYFKREALDKQRKFKEKVRIARIDYNFLQYLRPISKWAERNFNLTRNDLEVLLFMYSINLFTYKEFMDEMKRIGVTGATTFTRLKNAG